MYKILFMISLFIFHPAWSYISEKGPGQGDVFVGSVSELDWPGDIGPRPKVVTGGEQSEWIIKPVDEEGPTFMIQVVDIRPSGPMAVSPTVLIKFVKQGPGQLPWPKVVTGPGQMPWFEVVEGPEQSEWFVVPVGEEEGPSFMIQVSDVRPSTPVLGPGQSEVAVKFVGPEQSEVFIQSVEGPGQGALGVEEEGPTFMIQSADGRPSGPMGVEAPTVLIQFADVRPSTPVFGPGYMPWRQPEVIEVAYDPKRVQELRELLKSGKPLPPYIIRPSSPAPKFVPKKSPGS